MLLIPLIVVWCFLAIYIGTAELFALLSTLAARKYFKKLPTLTYTRPLKYGLVYADGDNFIWFPGDGSFKIGEMLYLHADFSTQTIWNYYWWRKYTQWWNAHVLINEEGEIKVV